MVILRENFNPKYILNEIIITVSFFLIQLDIDKINDGIGNLSEKLDVREKPII